jgi:hypothetical protein
MKMPPAAAAATPAALVRLVVVTVMAGSWGCPGGWLAMNRNLGAAWVSANHQVM